MTFGESIKTCFSKYADFTGRASRSEYWWWFLFLVLGNIAASLISETVNGLFSLATILPTVAVGCRRLHDIDKSGWWQLLNFLPIIGWIVLLYWAVQEGSGAEPILIRYLLSLSAGVLGSRRNAHRARGRDCRWRYDYRTRCQSPAAQDSPRRHRCPRKGSVVR